MKFSARLRVKDWMFSLTLAGIKFPEEYTWGMASRCSDNTHVTFLDYDRVYQEILEEEIQVIQERDELGPFVLLQTRETTEEIEGEKRKIGIGWHAICVDKRPIRKVIDTCYDSSSDIAFKKAPFFYYYRSWILRIFPKGKREPPKFIKIIESPYSKYEQSSVHAKFLKLWYGVDYPLTRPDGEMTAPNLPPLRVVSYRTGSRVEEETE